MKWFSCTPVSFKGNFPFRDTGAYCTGFKSLGIESRLVMPLPSYAEDSPDVLRTEYSNLENSEWWRSLHLDGVVLYSWSLPRYTPIAKAIHESGTKLAIYLDTNEVVYPFQAWRGGTLLAARTAKAKHPQFWMAHFFKTILHAHLNVINYPKRRRHLGYADIIGIPSPGGVENHKKIPLLLSKTSKNKLFLMPCPITDCNRHDGTSKEKRVMAVGRWDDLSQKRPFYLMTAVEIALAKDLELKFDLFGLAPDFIRKWRDSLPDDVRQRIALHGIKPNVEIGVYLRKSMACLCSSSHESTHLVSAEAVCNGASIVVPPLSTLKVVQWYASEDSGTIAEKDTPESFAAAICQEVENWAQKRRDPQKISDTWCSRLHVQETIRKLFARLAVFPPSEA